MDNLLMNPKAAGKSVVVEDDEHVLAALNLLRALAFPMVLKSASELNLFDAMAAAGGETWVSPSDIASRLPTKNPDAPDMLDRMLGYLSCLGVVKCKLQAVTDLDGREVADHQKRLYRLTPVSKLFTETEGQVSLSPLLSLMHNKTGIETWCQLTDSVLEGGTPFVRAHGLPLYENNQQDERENGRFNRAMFTQGTLIMRKILDIYKGFDGVDVLVDVGGGTGSTLSVITSKYPNIKGINFDLPQAVKNARSYPGLEHVAGDMFERVPNGDAIFLKLVLHNWSDEPCLKLLKNCNQALSDNGVVIVVEVILPNVPDKNLASEMAYHKHLGMMVHTGGRERTWQQYEMLAQKSGFSRCEVVCCAYGHSLMEFHKKAN